MGAWKSRVDGTTERISTRIRREGHTPEAGGGGQVQAGGPGMMGVHPRLPHRNHPAAQLTHNATGTRAKGGGTSRSELDPAHMCAEGTKASGCGWRLQGGLQDDAPGVAANGEAGGGCPRVLWLR